MAEVSRHVAVGVGDCRRCRVGGCTLEVVSRDSPTINAEKTKKTHQYESRRLVVSPSRPLKGHSLGALSMLSRRKSEGRGNMRRS